MDEMERKRYRRNCRNNKVIEKFQKHQYNKCWIFALVNKETPLRNLTLYDGLNNWCGCGEIDLGADMFTYHMRRSHRGIKFKTEIMDK